MQLTHLVALIPAIQVALAYTIPYESFSEIYVRDIDDLLYPESALLLARASTKPTAKKDSSSAFLKPTPGGGVKKNSGSSRPKIDYKKIGPETTKHKINSGVPSTLTLGGDKNRGDMHGMHGSKAKGTMVDHAFPVGTKEGSQKSKDGKNPLKELSEKEQRKEGQAWSQAEQHRKKTGQDKVDLVVGDKPLGDLSGGGRKAGSSGGRAAAQGPKKYSRRSLLDGDVLETREIFARDAAADAYAEALVAFDDALGMEMQKRSLFALEDGFEMEMQKREAFAFADPEAFVDDVEELYF